MKCDLESIGLAVKFSPYENVRDLTGADTQGRLGVDTSQVPYISYGLKFTASPMIKAHTSYRRTPGRTRACHLELTAARLTFATKDSEREISVPGFSGPAIEAAESATAPAQSQYPVYTIIVLVRRVVNPGTETE